MSQTPHPVTIPVAIYSRVSTFHQIGGRFTSCESQEAICREFIAKHAADGWQEISCHRDAAYSGSSLKRPGMEALKRQIAAGEVKVVVLFMLERVLRSTDEWSSFRTFLQTHGCRLESPTGDISEDDPEGRLKNNIVMSMAEYTRLSTAKKTKLKMHEQAKRGFWNGGLVPYGYTYDKNTQRLSPDPIEGPILREIFADAAMLVPLQEIANRLNARGHRTKERLRQRRDGTQVTVGRRIFRSDGLRFILRNPIYRGIVRFGGEEYPAQHEALVTPEVWEQANAAAAEIQPPASGLQLNRDKHFHLLKGLLHCGRCGRAMVPHRSGKLTPAGKPYRYYDCSAVLKERNGATCAIRRVPAGPIERAVTLFLGQVSRHPEVIRAGLSSTVLSQHKDKHQWQARLLKIDSEYSIVAQKLANCALALTNAGAAALTEELTSLATTLRARKQELLLERERAQQELSAAQQGSVDEQQVRAAMDHFGELLPRLEPAEQKKLAALLVERIEIRIPSGAKKLVGARHLELSFKLHIPRLAEGVSDKGLGDLTAPAPGRRLVLSMETALAPEGATGQTQILRPFVYPPASEAESLGDTKTNLHPVHNARAWQKTLQTQSGLSQRNLAKSLGLSAPSVTFHLQLLKLVPEIQRFLLQLRHPHSIHYFSVRRMKALAGVGEAEQQQIFRHWCDLYRQQRPDIPLPTVKHFSPRIPAKRGFSQKAKKGQFRMRTWT